MGEKMKALFYDGPFKVSVKETDMPKIKHPDDVIIKVTTSCICGSAYLNRLKNFPLKETFADPLNCSGDLHM
jgi:threonine dehydrogenase-like Zn-dependent dehydrogenase